MEMKCNSCDREVQATWKYCRYCGSVQPKREIVVTQIESTETIEDLGSSQQEVQKEVEFNRELYYDVLSTRSHRLELINRKKELMGAIDALLDQVQSGLVTRDYALPKIKEVKAQVVEVTQSEKQYENLPDKLPLEVLLDEIDAAEERLHKIDALKHDPVISKEAIRDAKNQSEESLDLLRDQQSKVNGHLRVWQSELRSELDGERKEVEQLYIRFKTGEITEEAYNERKTKRTDAITTKDNVMQLISNMLD
ncbi:MAG: hypothetical protein ACW98K_04645 [Candidatus Kariarchaeaceae archaeon]|jgi:hypothetical protein